MRLPFLCAQWLTFLSLRLKIWSNKPERCDFLELANCPLPTVYSQPAVQTFNNPVMVESKTVFHPRWCNPGGPGIISIHWIFRTVRLEMSGWIIIGVCPTGKKSAQGFRGHKKLGSPQPTHSKPFTADNTVISRTLADLAKAVPLSHVHPSIRTSIHSCIHSSIHSSIQTFVHSKTNPKYYPPILSRPLCPKYYTVCGSQPPDRMVGFWRLPLARDPTGKHWPHLKFLVKNILTCQWHISLISVNMLVTKHSYWLRHLVWDFSLIGWH